MLERKVNCLEELVSSYQKDFARQNPKKFASDPIFRGQANANWPLQTTLERASCPKTSVIEYMRCLSIICDQVEAVGLGCFAMGPKLPKNSGSFEKSRSAVALAMLSRQHAFPSPLLDWSRSPYVAAYFACRGADVNADMAIYGFQEYVKGSKEMHLGRPTIRELPPSVGGVERHYRQQVVYTYCVEEHDEHEESFVPHTGWNAYSSTQDRLVKYIIPSCARAEMLRGLQLMNINEFTLFGGVDALFRHLAVEAFGSSSQSAA